MKSNRRKPDNHFLLLEPTASRAWKSWRAMSDTVGSVAFITADRLGNTGGGSVQDSPADRCGFETCLSHDLAIPPGELIQTVFTSGIGKALIPTSHEGYAIQVMRVSSLPQA